MKKQIKLLFVSIYMTAFLSVFLFPGNLYGQPNVPNGYVISEFATNINNPTCIAYTPSGSSYETALYVGSNTAPTDPYWGNPGDQNQPDIIFIVTSDGFIPFVTLPGESDPVSLRFTTDESIFGEYLYISANNRDGGDWGDYGGAILRVDYQHDLEDFVYPSGGPPKPGDEPCTTPFLYEPVGIAFGFGGDFGFDLYVANSSDQCADIVTVNEDGVIQGPPYFLDDDLIDPSGYGAYFIEFSPGGNWGNYLFFNDFTCNCVKRVDPSGNVSNLTSNDSVPSPQGMRFGPGGCFGTELYIISHTNNSILNAASDGTVSVFATGFSDLRGDSLAFSPDNHFLYVADFGANKIYEITPPGPISYSGVGFDPPMNGGTVTVKKKRALPFKAQLLDADGLPVTDESIEGNPPVIQVQFTPKSGGATVDVTDEALSAGKGTDGNQFEFSGGKWQFNLKTGNYTGIGTYIVTMEPGIGCYTIDNIPEASFEIKQK